MTKGQSRYADGIPGDIVNKVGPTKFTFFGEKFLLRWWLLVCYTTDNTTQTIQYKRTKKIIVYEKL